MRASKSIGILREVKSKWERRVAITPSEVSKLVDRNIKVLIEPCERRIFKDIDYKNVGAIVTNNLSECSFIIGVKDIESCKLFENHSYLNFSHVIKGQASNMGFLDECLSKNIRLFDYECIVDANTKLRRVAFGRFAGLSGMITGMRGLGEHLLAQGCATPFLNISSTYMYNSLFDAQQQVVQIGEMITKYGLPPKYGPFVFTFTGGGNVTNGALEIFKLLPHEFIDASDLHLLSNNSNSNKVYGCILSTQSIVEHKRNKTNFDEKHYFEYPEEYLPIFHTHIAPYTSVLINGMYWDHRYPRLLTITQMRDLQQFNPQCMLALFDISCDIEGAVEFLKTTTNTDSPYYTYNIQFDTINHEIDGDGILILAVDSLPAELPRDSSEYFSKTLYPYLERLATSHSNVDINIMEKHLGNEMFNAMITFNGKLTKNFKYISALRREQKMNIIKSNENIIISKLLKIDGHLFDSGIINQILDMIEINNCEYNILNLDSKVNTRQLQKASRLILQIDMFNDNNNNKMEELINKLKTLCELHPKAEAKLIILPFGATHKYKNKNKNNITQEEEEEEYKEINKKNNKNFIPNERNENINALKNILLFGSGFVSKPVIDYLSMSGNNIITIATNDINAAQIICNNNKYCKIIEFNVLFDNIDELISKHDIIISLLPATMHIPIAKSCIKYQKDMTTASYISNEMKELNSEAIKSNIILLNECGLDPGLDHMSAIKLINNIENENKNEEIIGFKSYCGGLPSPESVDNLFGYKFSWSPMGVLNASLNNAKYLENGNIININNNQLLINGIGTNELKYFDNPYHSLLLQHIANRDSLKYIQKYKLNKNKLKYMYRGTLRYYGFTDMLYGCKILGLLNNNNDNVLNANKDESWYDYLWRIINYNIANNKYKNNVSNKNEDELKCIIEDILLQNTEWKSDKINLFLQCLENDLNIFNKNECKILNNHKYIINAFCELLENKLYYNNNNEYIEERDMVLMINKIFTNKNKIYESSLLVYGDEYYSAMAKTVGFPLAIATQFLLNNNIDKKCENNIGVIDATNVILANMVLDKCEQFGIKFKNRIITQNINDNEISKQQI